MIKTNPEYKYYTKGLYVKLLGGLSLCLIYSLYYGGGDTVNYFSDGVCMMRLLFEDPTGFFVVMRDGLDISNYFYFNEDTASMIAGRKALTKGDDKNHHIERVLIKRLLPDSEHNYGYLFVYTTLPPCNTDKIGCLGFYMQLAQHNPNLRTIVMFDHEYEDGSNYTSLTTANFTMVNRVKAAKAIEQAESRKSSIAKMALTLTRATSDQIVSALQKKDDETAVEILKKFEDSDSERGKRLSQKLLHKQVAAG